MSHADHCLGKNNFDPEELCTCKPEWTEWYDLEGAARLVNDCPAHNPNAQWTVPHYWQNHLNLAFNKGKQFATEAPRWMRRPSGPGVWLLFSRDGQFKYNALALDADDLARGAPFACDLVYGPIEEPFAIALEDSTPSADGTHVGRIEIL